ncbi:hypothetical protein PIB30_016744 [Stylosanthes scabra]|uniref:Acyl-[acyl-carrier-protein] hydrolase n=1 Tax=Stylosanthes scabra TaxID=79078 RepID=A0ABU6Z6Z4_9FABA|nr:hypothetical protein [Stylosanthes scabra]
MASIQTLMNYFQESAINHFKTFGLHRDGYYGSTKEMMKRNLIWIFTHTRMEVYRYPIWNEVVEVEIWMSLAGKNAVRSNWLLRDSKTNEVLSRASRFRKNREAEAEQETEAFEKGAVENASQKIEI